MPDSFGARLRRRREERAIDLASISELTKIKLSLLEGLERDDLSHWPSGIFRRAYIRTYAHAIGVDPDAALREFLEVYPEPVDELTAKEAAALEEAAKKNAPPPTRLRTIVDSALDSLAKLRRARALETQSPSPGLDHEPARPHFDAPAPALDSLAEEVGYFTAPAADTRRDEESQPVRAAALPVRSSDAQRSAAPEAAASSVARPSRTPASADALPLLDEAQVEERRPAEAREVVEPVAAIVDAVEPAAPAADDSRLDAVSRICTELGRAASRDEVLLLLETSARVLDATGLIVWLWDDATGQLRPALVHGYSDRVLAHLPAVRRDADNPTAAAFREGSPREVPASAQATGALVVPLLTAGGCVGVLAAELQPAVQPAPWRRAIATILAASLAQLVDRSRPARRSPGGRDLPAAR